MAKLSELDPNQRCCVLVGQFLQHWAILEYRIDQALGKALGLDEVQNAIVCANVGFREKLFILKTAAHESLASQEDRTRFRLLLDKIQTYSSKRNMIAHRMFMATNDGQRVSFMVTKATGSLSILDVEWSLSEFDAAYEKMVKFATQLGELRSQISRAKIAQALLASSLRNLGIGEPTPGQTVPTMFGLLSHPPEGPLDSSPPASTPETPSKTPRPSPASKKKRKGKPPKRRS